MRCYLVHALAPEGTNARTANDLLNEYVADGRRGLAVWHDHFVGEADGHAGKAGMASRRHRKRCLSGGAVVLDVRTDAERAVLAEPGPLAGWRLQVHPLTFSLTAVGFAAQTAFTLERYRGVRLEELAAAEPDDPRYWWKGRER